MAANLRNPFKPTAGMNPPELIGRDAVLDAFAESLDNGPGAPDRLMRVSGIRGIGKTVMLNALGDVAASRGFHVVNVASDAGFCERIAQMVAPVASFQTVTVEPELWGLKAGSIGFEKAVPAFGEILYKASCKTGLFVTVDEVQDASHDELRALGNEIQLLIRRGANVAFAFAGLPFSVDGIVNGKGLTFLQRAKQVTLTRLKDYQVQDSLEDTVRSSGMAISPAVAEAITEAAAGYPFMVQLVGYHTWQTAARRGSEVISAADMERGVQTARKDFDAMVIEPALRRLPDGQIAYLLAMAGCGEKFASSGEVAQAMGRDTKDVSSFRRRLIDANLIEPLGYGKVGFAIPYLREYLLSHRDDILEDIGALSR